MSSLLSTGGQRRMTDAEALLWSLEADPSLRSAFISVTFLDRPPDFARFRDRVASAVALVDGLSHRVVPTPLDLLAPRWEPDPAFDLDYHVRRLALPRPGTARQLLDLAALICQDPLDPARPLWQFTVVEGVDDGAALLAKMHHVLSDGIGAIRMSSAFLELSPDGDPLRPGPTTIQPEDGPTPANPGGLVGVIESVGHAASLLAGPLDVARRGAVGAFDTMRRPDHLPRQARASAAVIRSLARQLAVLEPARSPLWTGHQSLGHRFEVLSVDLDEVRSTAKRLGGTVNDVFVSAVVAGAGAYHRKRGVEVDELRMSMPVSTRHDRAVGGNAWVPTRMLVPAGDLDPATRFALVHRRLDETKREPSLGLTQALVGVVRTLPAPLLIRLARQQTGTVDFACSNVRGAPFDLWISGARVLSNHPMGPTAGTPFNATVLSYKGRLDLGLNVDAGAVDDPPELSECIHRGFSELFAAAG